MRHFCLFGLLLAAVGSVWMTGCSRKTTTVVEVPATSSQPAAEQADNSTTTEPSTVTPDGSAPNSATAQPLDVAPPAPVASVQEKYDAALLQALNYMAERKYADALVSLGTANALQPGDQVQQQIDKVKVLLTQQADAEKTAQNIKNVLDNGKPEDAARLATESLQQFGASEQADKLAALKRQADALGATQGEDDANRQVRLRQEGETALAQKNLRAASIVFEQALTCGEDAALRKQYDEVKATLARYDDNRQRAAELRRDPANLEDALAALREAATAWDTLEIRQDIDLYSLALEKRRDRISVADFDIRGDVGIPAATFAEELLPRFKNRFDLVERSQLARIVGELRLEASTLAESEDDRREVGRLARIRYLVVGSITPLNGILANARLVDVRSGLVVQTAKVMARSPDELLRLLPQLATQLLMTDEQKCAYEQQLAQQTQLVVQPVLIAPLPPAPEPIAVGQLPPAPIVMYTPRPPDFGGVQPEDLDRLPLLPAGGQPVVAAEVIVEREAPVKQRLLQIAVSLGDNLFRRGRYQEAHKQFELALSISPGHVDLRLRIDRCRDRLPPPVVVVAPRPRIAVLSFIVNADPRLTPPGFSDWAAEQMASYFTPTYEVVDRGELFWYMGRLGVSVRDVAVNPSARLWLARAMNVRYFAFGVVQQTASFNVTSHLVDAETGNRQGLGSVHVQDHQELELRMAELVKQTQTNPAERDRTQREAQENERQLNQVRNLLKTGQAAQALAISREALKLSPNNVAMQVLFNQADQQVRVAALEAARRRELAQRQAQVLALQRRQQDLARQAEAARRRAEQDAAARGEAARKAQALQRQRAFDQLMTQAHAAVQQRQYASAIQSMESALALQPNENTRRELAQIKSSVEKSTQAQMAQEKARKDAELQRQREADLARTRAQVDAQRRQREAEDLSRRKAQEARDLAAYNKLIGDGKALFAQGKYDAAAATLQSAKQLRKTPEVDQLINQVAQKQAADRQALARAEEQKRQAAMKAASPPVAKDANKRQAEYEAAMQAGGKAMFADRYDDAIRAFGDALKARPGDAQAASLLGQVQKAQADQKKKQDAAKAALTQPRPAPPVQPRPAPPVQPKTVPPAQPKPPSPAAVAAAYNKYMQAAAALEKQQKYDEALANYKEALKLAPNDIKASVGQHMVTGQKALKGRKFTDAAREFDAVLKLSPGHAEATKGLMQARQGK